MSLQERFETKGVTIVELLIVMGIMIVVGILTIPLGSSFLERNALRTKSNEVYVSLKVAQINSISAKNGDTWGVRVGGGNITLFQGADYATRVVDQDRIFVVPASIGITNFEVVFEKNSGIPDSPINISIQNNFQTKQLILNEVGNVDII